MTNQSGDFEATKTGDRSHPLAERIAPDAEDVARCGSEAVLHFVFVEVQGDELLLHAIDGAGNEFDQLAISHAG